MDVCVVVAVKRRTNMINSGGRIVLNIGKRINNALKRMRNR